MCYDKQDRNDIPMGAGAQIGRADEAKSTLTESCEPSLRDRLERKRTRLQRQLAQIDAALQVLYTVPNAEQIAAILQQV